MEVLYNYNSVNDLSTKLCVPSCTEDVNVKALNILTKTNEPKTMIKYILCDCKYYFYGKKLEPKME